MPTCWALAGLLTEAEHMDIELIRGIVLIALFLAFIGMWVWAWSNKRKPDFEEASMLPLEEDQEPLSENGQD